MLNLYMVGESHDNEEDVRYREIVEQAAEANNLLYIKEGKIFGSFDLEEKVYASHPNILGIEDLYVFMLTNLCLARACISNISEGSKKYALTLFAKEGVASTEISEEGKVTAKKLLEQLEPEFEVNRKSYEEDKINIITYIKIVTQSIFVEIFGVDQHPIKKFLEEEKLVLIREYAERELFSKIQKAIEVKDSLYVTNIEIDNSVIIKFINDIRKWSDLIKNLMLKLIEVIKQSGKYKGYEQYLDEKFIEYLFSANNLTTEMICPIALNLRNRSWFLNIQLLLDKHIETTGLPIYAVMGDRHLEELQQWLGSSYRGINICYFPLSGGRGNRPKLPSPRNESPEKPQGGSYKNINHSIGGNIPGNESASLEGAEVRLMPESEEKGNLKEEEVQENYSDIEKQPVLARKNEDSLAEIVTLSDYEQEESSGEEEEEGYLSGFSN